MSVKVLIPTPLQKFTNGEASVECDAADVRGLVDALENAFPGIKTRLCDDNGELRRFLNVYVKEEDIRFLDGIDTKLESGVEVSIVPAVAGG